MNVDDRDASRFLRYFTLLAREEIEALELELAAHPERRAAQQALARDVTTRVHGEERRGRRRTSRRCCSGRGEASSLSAEAFEALRDEVPFVQLPALSAEGVDAVDLFVAAKLAPSKGAGRRLLEQGGLSVNGKKLSAEERVVRGDSMLVGGHLLLRKGAREYALVRVGGIATCSHEGRFASLLSAYDVLQYAELAFDAHRQEHKWEDSLAELEERWLPVIGRALAFLCIHAADLRDKDVGEQAAVLQSLGLSNEDIAALIDHAKFRKSASSKQAQAKRRRKEWP